MQRWNLILRVFLSEYLNLRPEDAPQKSKYRSDDELVRTVFILLGRTLMSSPVALEQ